MTNLVAIVADDLTGAIDSAAPFAARGARVRIALHPDAVAEAAASNPAVLAVTTGSRHLRPAAAADRVTAAWTALAPLAPRVLVKKIDSRLQGACGAEAARLLTMSGRSRAIVCPAVPQQQRIVAGGWLAGRGLARSINVADHFAQMPAAFPDATDAAGLGTIADAVLADPARIMAVGATGLASALAERLFGQPRSATAAPPDLPLLIAIGSQDPITDAQIERLQRDYPELDGLAPDEGMVVRLHRMAAGPQPDPAQALARFAALTARDAQDVRTLLCSGGDTAAAVMEALGTRQLEPDGEWCAGVPVARVTGRPGLRLFTKSGGFGDADVLSRIVAHGRAGIRQDAA